MSKNSLGEFNNGLYAEAVLAGQEIGLEVGREIDATSFDFISIEQLRAFSKWLIDMADKAERSTAKR